MKHSNFRSICPFQSSEWISCMIDRLRPNPRIIFPSSLLQYQPFPEVVVESVPGCQLASAKSVCFDIYLSLSFSLKLDSFPLVTLPQIWSRDTYGICRHWASIFDRHDFNHEWNEWISLPRWDVSALSN